MIPTSSAEPGVTLVSRRCWATAFAMTGVVIVPIDANWVEEPLMEEITMQHHPHLQRLADDPKFAAVIHRSALDAGIMEHVALESPRGPSHDKKWPQPGSDPEFAPVPIGEQGLGVAYQRNDWYMVRPI
jgi:hypothetical protein